MISGNLAALKREGSMKLNQLQKQLHNAKRQELSLSGFLLLVTLSRKDLYMREIRDILDMDHGTLNKITNRLIARKLIKKKKVRCPSDNPGAPKTALLMLTAKGHKIISINPP